MVAAVVVVVVVVAAIVDFDVVVVVDRGIDGFIARDKRQRAVGSVSIYSAW